MTEKQSGFFGYEWSFTCPDCDEVLELSGLFGETPRINGEREFRTRRLHDGDTIGCTECGTNWNLNLEKE